MMAGLSNRERVDVAIVFKYIFLSDKHQVYFIVTSSTQPLLWTSLDYALANGVTLLHSPTAILLLISLMALCSLTQ